MVVSCRSLWFIRSGLEAVFGRWGGDGPWLGGLWRVVPGEVCVTLVVVTLYGSLWRTSLPYVVPHGRIFLCSQYTW